MEPAVWIAVAIIAFFALWGFKDGVVKRLVEVAGAVLTVILTARFAARVTPTVADKIGWSEETALLVTWVAMIVVGLLLSRLLARLIGKAVRLTVLGWVDRTGGAACGAALGMIVCSVALLVLGALPGGQELQAKYRNDAVGAFIIDTAPNLARQARLVAGDRFDELWGRIARTADEKADAAAARAKQKLEEAKREAAETAQEAVGR
ncbi:MAG: CvpA family protein [Candidatus Krumholzibacteriia bacterium]